MTGKVQPWVVVAEDDGDMLLLVARVLRRAGYRVEVTTNGDDLHSVLKNAHLSTQMPAVVVSDVRMPGRDIMSVVEQIRTWGWTIPVLLITAFADDCLIDAASEVDATAVLSKPFDLDDLRLVLGALVNGGNRLPA